MPVREAALDVTAGAEAAWHGVGWPPLPFPLTAHPLLHILPEDHRVATTTTTIGGFT